MRKQMINNEELLRGGRFPSLLLKLSLPAVLVTMVIVLYNIADTLFIGQTGDPNKVAAVSLASPAFTVLTGLGVLLGQGGCTAASLALGRGDYGRIRRISAFCLWAALAIGLAFAAGALVFLEPLCALLGADGQTMGFTKDYMRLCALGAPAIIFSNVAPSLIRADGSVRVGLAGNFLGTAVNIALDPLLILGLDWGVSGAALATVLGNVAASLCYLRFLRGGKSVYSLSLRDVSLSVARPVVSLGLPMACSTILMSVSSAVANNRMMMYGPTSLAAQSVAGKVGMLISMVIIGIGVGMQPAISFNYSAENKARLREIVRKTAAAAVIAGAALSGLCLAFSDSVLAAFLNNEEVLRVGKCCLYAAAAAGPFYGVYQVATTYLQATGKTGRALAAALLEKGLIFLPALFLMQAAFGMNGLIFAGAVTTLLSTVAALILCRKAVKGVKTHEQGEKRAIQGDRPAHSGLCAERTAA
ncbi:MAG: MATE family efflux transporter [Clostridia bacterium]|nr:MATE family efflux transporter [Clostridia bacterium]